jgi:hypothetical protein
MFLNLSNEIKIGRLSCNLLSIFMRNTYLLKKITKWLIKSTIKYTIKALPIRYIFHVYWYNFKLNVKIQYNINSIIIVKLNMNIDFK